MIATGAGSLAQFAEFSLCLTRLVEPAMGQSRIHFNDFTRNDLIAACCAPAGAMPFHEDLT